MSEPVYLPRRVALRLAGAVALGLAFLIYRLLVR